MAMDSRIGLDYIVENPEYIAKLAAALDTPNVTVKKQVLELLSALCVYNSDGYARALDALERYKLDSPPSKFPLFFAPGGPHTTQKFYEMSLISWVTEAGEVDTTFRPIEFEDLDRFYEELKGERYRLKIVVSELQSTSAVDYQTALVAFINCLLISTPQLKDRIRIRNEFIGLKLLPVLNELRRSAASVPDLGVQLDVFDEQRESDEAQALQGPHGVDLNSHLDVFYAILRQVSDTPQEIPFLSILQHLLRVDPKEAVSDLVWDAAERLVHRATLLESLHDASRLLRSPSVSAAKPQAGCHCTCHSRKQSAASPPPPPPPPPPGPPPPPPPPPLGPARAKGVPGVAGGPPMPPPLLAAPSVLPPASPEPTEGNGKLLPQQETPTPKAKMKTINWNKIPEHKVVGKNNIWSLVARSHQHSPMADLDWAEMEGLFCQQALPAPSLQASPRLGRDVDSDPRRRKESSEIVLLDGKRSLNVNIFLKQFRSCNDDIIQLIRDGAHDEIGAEKLRGLLKILPEVDELEMLRAFDGDKSKLGNAEKFLLQLIEVPNYKLRIESMLLKEEFAANMNYLEPSITAMIVAGEDLITNKPLQEVLYMVLVAGNFLNSGGYAGNAAGVKLSSLQKLTDIRANKPGMNLIHYVAMQAEKKRKDLLRFTEDMSALEDATKTTVEQLQNEINALDTRIKKVHKQIDLSSTEKEIKGQMTEFLQLAEREVAGLQNDMEELERVRIKLAEFFCEDVGTFKLEECFKVFHGFCTKFRQAVAENERRKIQEEQANMRRRQREEQLAAKRRQMSGQLGPTGSESESNLVDSLLYDIRSGFSPNKPFDRDIKGKRLQNGGVTSEEDISITGSPLVTRRRMGSFSGPSGDQAPGAGREDNYSPDIIEHLRNQGFRTRKDVTPNGSLRRRRSRVPSEEDDSNLMDFLRASGHDGSRERKSWGSLDRSWARRARGGGRKRPELLSADFSVDRERPTSPSPLAEEKPTVTNTEGESKPKAWRQKIEAWLQENEKEEKQNEDLRRRTRRVQSNRRSLEADSESEGRGSTLDTLPEEKTTLSQGTQYQRVYPDWKPTIEKTDVVRAMEAIEEAQPQPSIKDKSAWRKSNLNVPNSTEDTEMDMRRLRRMRSRGSLDTGSQGNPLQAIKEEDKRKGIIGSLGQVAPVQDRLTVYLRRPSEQTETTSTPTTPEAVTHYPRRRSTDLSEAGSTSLPGSPLLTRSQLIQKYRHSMDVPGDFLKTIVGEKSTTKTDEEQILPPSVPRRLRKGREEHSVSDKVEIDSDNIETPPATRRSYNRTESNSEDSTVKKLSARTNLDDQQYQRLSRPSVISPDTPCKRLTIEEKEPVIKRTERYHTDRLSDTMSKSVDSSSIKKLDTRDKEEEEMMGDGQFDRFSSTRRTRRYKKNQDNSEKDGGISHSDEPNITKRSEIVSPELVPEKQIIRPTTLQVQSYSLSHSPLSPEDKESRLKKWQDRLKYRGSQDEGKVTEEAMADITNAGEELQNLDRVPSFRTSYRYKQGGDQADSFKLEKERFGSSVSSDSKNTETRTRPRNLTNVNRERVRSMIEPRQVEEALKLNRENVFPNHRKSEVNRSFVLKGSGPDKHTSKTSGLTSYNSTNPRESHKDEVLNATSQNAKIKSNFIPEICVQASMPGHAKGSQNRNEHELNDEGFEETQSLVSETLSQETSSGCNYEIDATDSSRSKSSEYKRSKGKQADIMRADSSGSGDTSSSTNAPVSMTGATSGQSLANRSLASSRAHNRLNSIKTDGISQTKIRSSKPVEAPTIFNQHSTSRLTRKNNGEEIRKSVIPLRTNSLSKTDSQSSISKSNGLSQQKRRGVERSNSRSSLRSSRSSLNSSTSVTTVKNAPPLSKSSSRSSVGSATQKNVRLSGYTSAIKALTTNLTKDANDSSRSSVSKFGYQQDRSSNKKPLTQVQLKNPVPASRSSSSGSSTGPAIRRPRVVSGVSTSFKENVGRKPSSVPASRSSSSGSSIGPIVRRPRPTAAVKENGSQQRLTSQRGASFMRPTAASAAKDTVSTPDQSVSKFRSSSRILK